MGVAGWAFVVRTVAHSHEVTADDLLETTDEAGAVTGFTGRTSLDRGHRHRVALDAAGAGVAETGQGHRHTIRRVGEGWEVTTPVGDFAADVIVNATWHGAKAISALAGMDLPLAPISGQIMTTPPQAPYVRSLIVVSHNPEIPDCPPRDLRQGADGRLWVGTVNHHGSGDAAVRRADTDAIRKAMTRVFPELADVPFARGWAGTRALPSDGLPVYGRVGAEPFYVAVPMSGIAEAAAAGRTMADLIVDGACPALPAAFSPDRLKDLPPPTGRMGH
jgi:glycine oxidase